MTSVQISTNPYLIKKGLKGSFREDSLVLGVTLPNFKDKGIR